MALTSDPRTHVTPDAFSISETVLGLPLAAPSRRLVALAIDGILIGIVSQLSWKLLGLIAALAFFRSATRRSASAGRVGRTFQYSAGCLGALILFSTLVVWTGSLQRLLIPDVDSAPGSRTGALGDAVAGLQAGAQLKSASSEDEAVDLGVEVARRTMRISDTPVAEALEIVRVAMPEDAPFDTEAALRRIAQELGEGGPPPETIESLPLNDVWSRYSLLAAADSLGDADRQELVQLQERLASQVAQDTLATLNRRLTGARRSTEELERELENARADLEREQESGGLFSWLVGTVDDLGLTFGWGALYLATFTTLMKGQTPGKRLLGLRVIRLDGLPMGWFHAFERAGGYAAGIATGLLGFAQVLWDPNRQGIHDKIVATVVVREGAPRAPGHWQSRL